MVKNFIIHCLGIIVGNQRRKESTDLGGGSMMMMQVYREDSINYKNAARVVYSGGREELIYCSNVRASYLLDKYGEHANMCVARPDHVFKNPHESLSVLSRDEILTVGQKYIMLELTKLEKLRRKHHAHVQEEVIPPPSDDSEEWLSSSAKQFYSNRETRPESLSGRRKCGGGGGIPSPPPPPDVVVRGGTGQKIPSIQKHKQNRMMQRQITTYTWEPTLTSIQEISP